MPFATHQAVEPSMYAFSPITVSSVLRWPIRAKEFLRSTNVTSLNDIIACPAPTQREQDWAFPSQKKWSRRTAARSASRANRDGEAPSGLLSPNSCRMSRKENYGHD